MEAGSAELMLDKNIKDRDRSSRTLVGFAICGAILLISVLVITAIFGSAAFLLGVGVGIIAIGLTIDHLSIYVPYTWAVVAQNVFTGNPVIYGSGWHWSYPWENVTEDDNISLEDRTSIKEGLTMASKTDELTLKISVHWRPNIKLLATFRGLDDSMIEGGFFEPMERFVSTLITHMGAEDARKNQSVMSSLALIAFKDESARKAEEVIGEKNDYHDVLIHELNQFREGVKTLEEKFGITIVQVNISDIDYSEEIRRARTAVGEQKSLEQLTYSIAGGKEAYNALSPQEQARVRGEARIISGNSSEKRLVIQND